MALPVAGWLTISFTGGEIDLSRFFTLPPLPAGENDGLGGAIFDIHALGGNVFIYLIGLHVLGALKHTFIDRNGGIFRMLPFGKVPG
ncbi:MAG: cytochrome b [Erythrobacter sp.]